MSRTLIVVLLLLLLLLAHLPSALARADDGASARSPSALVGEPFLIDLIVEAEPGATVDVEPGAESWGPVEVLLVREHEVVAGEGGDLHRFAVEVAAFAPGTVTFSPAVVVADWEGATVRVLPAITVEVPSVLRPGEPLALWPLPAPTAIGGGVPWWLRPLLVGSGGAALAGAGALLWLALARRRRTAPAPAPPPPAPAVPPLEELAAAVERDPVTGYRRIAAVVRAVLAERYRLPAPALTSAELRRRLEEATADRWLARLVAGLLEECDLVVYGGYRPPPERRQADVAMAAEILKEGG